ncbi:MAG TPA: 4-(cytidine 5'-diphospho)-2-C-methyl-D-erythritol kinase [Elusimicrobiota bacterium]|nr:4-(cytidine 5'-diphospho)-2-C-methyl-D-erythritol kinase [Elusimicrobiota bacterium]
MTKGSVRRVRLEACAKVNLFLEIVRRRPDGYHELKTLFQEISLGDTLEVAASPSATPVDPEKGIETFRCVGAALPTDNGNLVSRAIRAFRGDGPWDRRYRLVLRKKIPVGAGLGGGSSDAAAALRACWHLDGNGRRAFPWERYVPLAARLGADVPFFLRGGLAEASGIGDRLTLLRPPSRRLWFVLIFPRVFVSTKWVYQRLRFPLTKHRSWRRLKTHILRGRPAREWAPLLFNRLEEVVVPRVPAVRKAKEALRQAGCLTSLMSGSGSAVFGPVESEKHGKDVLGRVRSGAWDAWLVSSRCRQESR